MSPTNAGERRVVLSTRYVTDPFVKRWRKIVVRVKDSVGCVGLESLWASPHKK